MATTVYDVLRYLVRRVGGGDEAAFRDLLLTIDATEQGHPSLEAYKEALAELAAADAPPPPKSQRELELENELAASRQEAEELRQRAASTAAQRPWEGQPPAPSAPAAGPLAPPPRAPTIPAAPPPPAAEPTPE